MSDKPTGFSISFGGAASPISGSANGFGVQSGFGTQATRAAKPTDPMADPEKLAIVGALVRKRLQANPDAEDLGGERADLFKIRNFLDRTECKRLVKLIDRKIGPSTLFAGTEIDGFRTSHTHYFEGDNPDVKALEAKIDGTLGLPHSHAETTQGQRYTEGQQFKHHHDFFHETEAYWQDERRRGGQRTWTAMMYLNEPEEGGATDFKELGLAVPPERGTLLVWNNIDRHGRPNMATLHAGTPVVAGRKYVITQWYRVFPWSLSLR